MKNSLTVFVFCFTVIPLWERSATTLVEKPLVHPDGNK